MSIGYPYELSGTDCHAKAAIALCEKMNWDGDLIAGGTKDGYVFVFADSDRVKNPTVKQVRAKSA